MKSKFPLGWILAVAALVLLAAMGFMSMYYTYGGEKLSVCIIVAVCLLAVPILLTAMLIKLKGVTKPFFFRSNAFKELGLLIVMLAGCIISMGLVDHFFNVNSKTKDISDITKGLSEKEKTMLSDYDDYVERRTNSFVEKLNMVVFESGNERIRASIIDSLGIDTTQSHENLVADIIDKGESFKHTITRDTVSNGSTVQASSSALNLKWWDLPKTMKRADNLAADFLAEIDKLVKRSKNGDADIQLYDIMIASGINVSSVESEKANLSWAYPSVNSVNIKHYFTDHDGFITTKWSVLVALAAFALALLPYFAAYRDPRNKGLMEIFKKPTNHV